MPTTTTTSIQSLLKTNNWVRNDRIGDPHERAKSHAKPTYALWHLSTANLSHAWLQGDPIESNYFNDLSALQAGTQLCIFPNSVQDVEAAYYAVAALLKEHGYQPVIRYHGTQPFIFIPEE